MPDRYLAALWWAEAIAERGRWTRILKKQKVRGTIIPSLDDEGFVRRIVRRRAKNRMARASRRRNRK